MNVSEKLAQEQIEKFERSITRSTWKLENQDISEESLSRVHSAIGMDEENIGLYKLLLGNVSAATEQFEKAAQRYFKEYEHKKTAEAEENDNTYWQIQTSILKRLTYSVILAGNDLFLEKLAEKVKDLDEGYKQKFSKTVHKYYYTKALAAVAANTENQQKYVTALRDSITETGTSHRQYFNAIADVLEGIVQTDEELVYDGLTYLIDHHDRDTNEDPQSVSDRISKRITAFVMLAQRRGIHVGIETRYVPDHILIDEEPEEQG